MRRSLLAGLTLLVSIGVANAAPPAQTPVPVPTPKAVTPAPAPKAAAPAPKAAATATKASATATKAAVPAPKPLAPTSDVPSAGASAPHDSSASDQSMKGGSDGTVFRTLTVQGEDRIHIEVERPELQLDLDPAKAPGLDWGSARDVLDRTTPDLTAPLLAVSAQETSPYLARPWLGRFASGPVARFQPNVSGVETWKLSVVNTRGEAVAKFEGKGAPPKELTWDGRLSTGGTLTPGATYSYVLEARDRAGNKRNFVGEGFRVNAVRFDGPGGPALAFTGHELDTQAGGTPPIVLEAASWLNQWPDAQKGVRIEATARSADEANALAQRVATALTPTLLGDPARVRVVATPATDAPDGGAVRITPGR
jgi:hypothetical protein